MIDFMKKLLAASVIVGLCVMAAGFAIIGTAAWWPLLKVSWSYWFG
jgi:hypothetical protein